MIRYALKCEKAHEFEAWFASSSAFDAQKRDGQVLCPACGSGNVSKRVMAPNIATGARQQSPENSSPKDKATAEAEQLARKLRDYVVSTSDNVGDRFAEEARKIHYEESEARGIYGSASSEEVSSLNDEGIDVYPLPPLPKDRN